MKNHSLLKQIVELNYCNTPIAIKHHEYDSFIIEANKLYTYTYGKGNEGFCPIKNKSRQYFKTLRACKKSLLRALGFGKDEIQLAFYEFERNKFERFCKKGDKS